MVKKGPSNKVGHYLLLGISTVAQTTTTPAVTTTPETQTTTNPPPAGFECGSRLVISGFTGANADLNGLATLAMKSDGTLEMNEGYPYYNLRV